MVLGVTHMINLWAVLAAAVVNMVMGSLWYGPLFGKKWLGYVGIKEADIEKAKKQGMALPMSLMFIGTLVMAATLAHILTASAIVSLSRSLMVGFGLWLGFVATTHLSSVLFERRPWGYYWLNMSYYLVVLLINSIILALWR